MAIEVKVVTPDQLATVHRETQQLPKRDRIPIGPGHPDYLELRRLEKRLADFAAAIKKDTSARRTLPKP